MEAGDDGQDSSLLSRSDMCCSARQERVITQYQYLHAGCPAVSLCAACEVTVATLCVAEAAAAAFCALRPLWHKMRLDEELSSPAEILQQKVNASEMLHLFYLCSAFTSEHLWSSPSLTNTSSVKENKGQNNFIPSGQSRLWKFVEWNCAVWSMYVECFVLQVW